MLRRILVDHARAHPCRTQKRVSLDQVCISPRTADLVALDGALTGLEQMQGTATSLITIMQETSGGVVLEVLRCRGWLPGIPYNSRSQIARNSPFPGMDPYLEALE